MKRKLYLLFLTSLIISTSHAQWHFSANINVNCGSQFNQYVNLANELSGVSFNTKQQCESARQSVTIDLSYGECYAKITTTPCSGSDIGGGTQYNDASIHNSDAIGEPYFAPNGAYVTSNTGRETEIKWEALNKSQSDATRGAKTGDPSFDGLFNDQLNAVPESKKDNSNDLYNIKPRNKRAIRHSIDDRENYNQKAKSSEDQEIVNMILQGVDSYSTDPSKLLKNGNTGGTYDMVTTNEKANLAANSDILEQEYTALEIETSQDVNNYKNGGSIIITETGLNDTENNCLNAKNDYNYYLEQLKKAQNKRQELKERCGNCENEQDALELDKRISDLYRTTETARKQIVKTADKIVKSTDDEEFQNNTRENPNIDIVKLRNDYQKIMKFYLYDCQTCGQKQ